MSKNEIHDRSSPSAEEPLEPTFTPPPQPADADVRSISDTKKLPSAKLEPAPATLHTGRVLAERWKVGERIGMGGMAAVHQCLDLRLERRVAIKILHPHIAEDPDARARLAREARAIAQLKHENVIEVYDYSIDDADCTWLVTELIEGQTLRQLADRRGKVMPEVAVMILVEILRALRAAHAVGVVHRDVKPENILVGMEGRPKLSDFGIAQVIGEQRMTLTGNLVGSPSYMSPEQAEGRRIDHRTDLFSAGTILYRLVTGTLPFLGSNAIETLRKVAAGVYVDPAEIEPNCAGSVAGIIRKAFAPKLQDRYQTADEMLKDLNQVLRDVGIYSTSEELPRFFADPDAFERDVAPRIARELSARGQTFLAAGDESRALDCFNRARSLGHSDENTLDLVRLLSSRRDKTRMKKRIAIAASALVVAVGVAGGALVAKEWAANSEARARTIDTTAGRRGDLPAPAAAAGATRARPDPISGPDGPEPAGGRSMDEPATEPAGARSKEDSAPEAAAGSAGALPVTVPAAAAPEPAPDRTRRAAPVPAVEKKRARTRATVSGAPSAAETPAPPSAPARASSGGASPAETPRGVLQIGASRWVDVYVDGVKLGRAPDQNGFRLPAGQHLLRAVNPHCAPVERQITITADETTRERLEIVCR